QPADHAADQLAHAVLALGRADVAAEVLGDDHVGRELRPGLRHLDVGLLEDHLALLVGDLGRAPLPGDGLERVLAGAGEVAGHRDALGTLAGASGRRVVADRAQSRASLASAARGRLAGAHDALSFRLPVRASVHASGWVR